MRRPAKRSARKPARIVQDAVLLFFHHPGAAPDAQKAAFPADCVALMFPDILLFDSKT
jgi:hypothetical protein